MLRAPLTLFDALIPRRCPMCAARGASGFCNACRPLLPWVTAACEVCGVKLPAPAVCGKCASPPRPVFYDRALIPFTYCAPVDEQIHQLKYNHRLGYAAALGAMISRHARAQHSPLPDALVPVPLHRRRLRARGFNQSLEIARHIGRELGIKVSHRALQRVRNTVPQVGLGGSARIANVKNAFLAAPSPYAHVALVDDVVTSGSTVNDAARALKHAGVEVVSVWAAAKTMQE